MNKVWLAIASAFLFFSVPSYASTTAEQCKEGLVTNELFEKMAKQEKLDILNTTNENNYSQR